MDLSQAEKLRDRIYERLAARRPQVETDEKYYRGDQPLTFATREWREANAARYTDFSDNWCGTVVNAEAERLVPIGVAGIERDAARILWDALRRNEFESQFSQGVVASLTTARCFVLVWADSAGEPIVTVEHPSNVEIEYDWENPRIRTAALKAWADDEMEFATLYTADQIFKWQRDRTDLVRERSPLLHLPRLRDLNGGGWEPRQGARDNSWPVRNPLGAVPVVELPNRPTLRGEPVSEIRGVQPMQDAINLLWAYLFLAADHASMPARVATATAPPMIPILDDKGKEIGKRPVNMKDLSEKRLLFLTGENAKIDEWQAARLDVFTETIEIAVGHIAAQTRTPPHYLVANKGLSNLSGDALTAAEIGLVQKASEFTKFTNPALREVLKLIAGVIGHGGLISQAGLATIAWRNQEIRSESQMADALVKKRQMGYPLEYLMELDGLSPDDVARVKIMQEQELSDPQFIAAMRPFGGDDENADNRGGTVQTSADGGSGNHAGA